jgi:hypothetical protein
MQSIMGGRKRHKNDRIMMGHTAANIHTTLSRHRTKLQDWVSSPVAEKSPAPEQYRAIN